MFILNVTFECVLFPYTCALGSAGQSLSETCLNQEPGFNSCTAGVCSGTTWARGEL